MSNFEQYFVSFTWILLSIIVYLIYEVYTENIDKNKNDLVLSFCLFSSLYFMFRFSLFNNIYIFSIVFDFIIILFYIKKNKVNAIAMSIFVIFLCYLLNFNSYIFIFKYIICFIIFYFCGNGKVFFALSIISNLLCFFVSTVNLDTLIYSSFYYLFYYFLYYFIIIILVKAEKIIEINISYKELMKENQLRDSLFKISHEIKNPIAVCKGYLDMFDSNNIDHFKKYIPIIKSEIEKTLNLLQDFSACKKVKLECDIIDISLLLDEIIENYRLLFDSKNIKFSAEISDDEIFIYGDYNRLNQVLLNIIKNSIEAIDYKKQSYIRIHTEVFDNKVKIYVEDNGVGMNSEVMSKMSEPFYTTKADGTGLGVLLSNEIISAHNGSIDYLSEEGIGTCAIITLPLYC